MFKVFKYMFLVNLYKKAKKRFMMLAVYLVLMVLISLILNDLIGVATGMNIYVLLLVKWISILLLLVLIVRNVVKIFHVATNPFEKKEDEKVVDTKKERILAKEKLFTKSDLILQKYMKEKTYEI